MIVNLAEQCCGDATGKVTAGSVGKDAQVLALEQLDDHFRRSGLAVGAADDNDALR